MACKILVCGGRDANIDSAIVDACINDILSQYSDSDIEFVSGTAKGGDKLGEDFAIANGFPVKYFKPDWQSYGRAAGPMRNKAMVEYINQFDCPIVIAFWDGHSKGTRSTIKFAQDLHIPVHIIRYKDYNNYVSAGIQLDGDSVIFNWNEDEPEDILPLVNQKIIQSTRKGHAFYYAFKANKTYDDWNKFLYSFKHSSNKAELKKLTDMLAKRLMDKFNRFDCILYPKSSSELNELMVKSIRDIDPYIIAYPVSKVSPSEVKFDWDLFDEKFKGTEEQYAKLKKSIERMMDRVHKSSTFSFQKQIPGMFRKYIYGFLDLGHFVDLNNLSDSDTILILDDILSTGSTISEIDRMLDDVGFEGDTVFYSIVYNK